MPRPLALAAALLAAAFAPAAPAFAAGEARVVILKPAKGSILLGITKELVPIAQGKGNDAALAHLIEGAIEQHLAADVPTTTPEGRAFHAAKAFHVREAFDVAIQIYQRIGRNSSAAKLLRIRRDTLNQLSRQFN